MLTFVATAMGNGDHHFSASFTAGELMVDVDSTDHPDVTDIQIESGRNRASAYPAAIVAGPYDGVTIAAPNPDFTATGPTIVFSVNFGKSCNFTMLLTIT